MQCGERSWAKKTQFRGLRIVTYFISITGPCGRFDFGVLGNKDILIVITGAAIWIDTVSYLGRAQD